MWLGKMTVMRSASPQMFQNELDHMCWEAQGKCNLSHMQVLDSYGLLHKIHRIKVTFFSVKNIRSSNTCSHIDCS